MKNSTQDFIKKAQQVHNNKYDYSKTIYTKSKDKVIIICLNMVNLNKRLTVI
jgi:hypothetical protein